MFRAAYEDFSKLEAEAKRRGWSCDADGSYLDFVDPGDLRIQTCKDFTSKPAAVRWLKAEINARKTAFGVGDIIEIENVARPDRCDYCTCQGEKPVHRYVVSDTGIDDEEALNECLDDD